MIRKARSRKRISLIPTPMTSPIRKIRRKARRTIQSRRKLKTPGRDGRTEAATAMIVGKRTRTRKSQRIRRRAKRTKRMIRRPKTKKKKSANCVRRRKRKKRRNDDRRPKRRRKSSSASKKRQRRRRKRRLRGSSREVVSIQIHRMKGRRKRKRKMTRRRERTAQTRQMMEEVRGRR